MTLARIGADLPAQVEGSRQSPPKDPERRALGAAPIPHLSVEDIAKMETAAHALSRRHGNEYGLFILTTFDTALRVNEVLPLCPKDIDLDNGYLVHVSREKGGHPPHAAISPTLAARLLSFAYQNKLEENDRLFSFIDRYAQYDPRLLGRACYGLWTQDSFDNRASTCQFITEGSS